MPAHVPIYLDWTFWAAAIALLAVVLSQLPPVHVLVLPKRLEIEVWSRAQIFHWLGNANVGLYIILGNAGGRTLRIESMALQVSRDGKLVAELPAQVYYETQTSQTPALLVPFALKPGEQWSHGVNLYEVFDRDMEKSARRQSAAIDADLRAKARPHYVMGSGTPVVAAPELVAPLAALFDRLFIWQPGEYQLCLKVVAQPGKASYQRKYRFTLFESDTEQLRQETGEYQNGSARFSQPGVWVPLADPTKDR